MKTTYISKIYAPDRVHKRYVRADHGGGYSWCETSSLASWYDLRQGTAEPDEIPEDIRAAADARLGYFPAYVEWPTA